MKRNHLLQTNRNTCVWTLANHPESLHDYTPTVTASRAEPRESHSR